MSLFNTIFGGVDEQFQQNVVATIEFEREMRRYKQSLEDKTNDILGKIEDNTQLDNDEKAFLIENADCKVITRLLLMRIQP